jgi:hypothetical protein
MKIFYILLLCIPFIGVKQLSAQQYEKAVGVRMGYSTGIYFDKQNSDLSSYRFMMSWRENGRHITAMKFFRKYRMEQLPDFLSLYYGFGFHAGYVKWHEQRNDPEFGYYVQRKTAPVFGVDAIIGLSYDLTKMPVSLTCDIKPFFDLWGKDSFKAQPYDFAIGAVYYF